MDTYKVAFENAPDPILFVGEDGRILDANAQAELALGYPPGELIGRPVEDLVPAGYGVAHRTHRREFLASPSARPMGRGMALFARRKDGSEFPVDIMLSPAHASQGRIVIAILRDITERKRAEELIKGLLQRQQLSAEAAGMGFWTYDADADRFECDRIFASLYGGRPEDFPDADSLRRRMHPEDRDVRERQARESVRLAGRYESEFRVLLPDGGVRWLGDLGKLLPAGEAPAPGRHFAGVTFDISARKEAEIRAREAQLRERELFDNASEGILLANLDGIYTDANAAICRMLDMTREEVIGRHVLDTLQPEEADRLALARERQLAGESVMSEWKLRRKDGSSLPAEICAKIFPDGRWQAFVRDISDRKRAEAEAHAAREREDELMENAAEGIFLADLEGRYTRVNSAGCRLLGFAREEIIGKTIVDFIPPEDIPRLAESKARLLSGQSGLEEWSLRRKDGSFVPVEITPQIFPDGRWQAFVRDISGRKELERRQEELIRSLRNSLKEIKTLRGLLPICSHCKKIRDDSGFWQQLEVYIHEHSGADFSHGICPACLEKHFPEYAGGRKETGDLEEAGGRSP